MKTHRIKIWLGIGSYLLAGTSTAALALGSGAAGGAVGLEDLSRTRAGGVEIAAGDEAGEKGEHRRSGGEQGEDGEKGEGGEKGRARTGGEAGEAGEAGAAPDETNVRFLFLLAKMEAHMDVAKRLVDRGRHDLAQPHFHHPYIEVYESVEHDLEARGIPPFEETLEHLGRAGDGRDAAKIGHEYDEAKEAIAKARGTVHADVAASASVQLKVAVALLKSAAHEYEEAVEDGRITNAEEYQDAWAFVDVAGRIIEGAAPALKKSWPQAHDRIAVHLAALQKAWPDVVPPERAAMSVQDVFATVSRIELAASPVVY